MAKKDEKNSNTAFTSTNNTAQLGEAVVQTAGAAGESAPAAGTAAPAARTASAGTAPEKKVTDRRFRITKTEATGPVQTWAGVTIVDGVGYCDLPGTAWHAKSSGYSVTDALTGKEYDGTKPATITANG